MGAGDVVEVAADASRTYEKVRDRLFGYALVAATVAGIVALIVLMLYVLWDALELHTGDPVWYLTYAVALGAPLAGVALYGRRNPDARAAGLRFAGVAVAGLAVGLTAYGVLFALDPRDVLVYAAVGLVPALGVALYGRRNRAATWTGPAVPVVAILGLLVAALQFGALRWVVAGLTEWATVCLLVAVPAAAAVGIVAARRFGSRRGATAAAATVGGALLAALGGLALGRNASLAAAVVPTSVAPAGLVVADVAATRRAGLPGVLGPFAVVAGLLAGTTAVGTLGVAGPEAWLSRTLLTGAFSTLDPRNAGIYPQLVGSIVLVGLMALIVFPVGVAAAVYLEEYAPGTGLGGRVTQLIQVNISNLAGVPSVVYGLLGLGLFANLLGLERGLLLAGSVTLGLLILPIVIVASQEALRAVPDSLRQASYGMGASRWQTVRDVVLPEAFPGILTGTILALGRAIGETAPLLLIGVATTKLSPPGGVFEKATALPLQIFASRSLPQPEYRYGVVAAAVVVLLALMLSMNALAIVLRNRYQR